jgi:hypothetical protein
MKIKNIIFVGLLLSLPVAGYAFDKANQPIAQQEPYMAQPNIVTIECMSYRTGKQVFGSATFKNGALTSWSLYDPVPGLDTTKMIMRYSAEYNLHKPTDYICQTTG